jgi:anti-sigma factor RsiW
MSEDRHKEAQRLILQSSTGSVTAGELRRLEEHLAVCRECAGIAAATDSTVCAIRSFSIRLDPQFVELTRLRVRRRAEELSRRRLPGAWFWIGSAVSWAWILASASYLYRGFGWMAQKAGIPSPLWQMGFVLWWAVPALILAAVLSLHTLQDASPMKDQD